jgi:predicted Zn-dependent protease
MPVLYDELFYDMLIKRFFLICTLPTFMIGCSEFYSSQPPAPVYGGGATVYSKAQPVTKPKAPKPIVPKQIKPEIPEIVTTTPLQESGAVTAPMELAPEPLTPEQAQEQDALASKQEPAQESTAAQSTQEPVISPPPEPDSAPPHFAPLESFVPLSPAVGALTLAANQESKSGNIEAATTTIERAIRIEPRNATLYYKLALLRLKQSKPRLAEDLAKKAVLLATNDPQLKKHSWLLVARAREIQGDVSGGKEARSNADKF